MEIKCTAEELLKLASADITPNDVVIKNIVSTEEQHKRIEEILKRIFDSKTK